MKTRYNIFNYFYKTTAYYLFKTNSPIFYRSAVNAITKGKNIMADQGTVKWFNPTKGFGFIQPANGGNDVFVHISAVEQAGMQGLFEGQKLEYEVQENRGKQAAGNLKVVEE